MRKSKSLIKNNPPMSGTTILFGIAIIALIIWLVTRKTTVSGTPSIAGTYSNTKTWNIEYNEDGMPVKITKTVNAKVI